MTNYAQDSYKLTVLNPMAACQVTLRSHPPSRGAAIRHPNPVAAGLFSSVFFYSSPSARPCPRPDSSLAAASAPIPDGCRRREVEGSGSLTRVRQSALRGALGEFEQILQSSSRRELRAA